MCTCANIYPSTDTVKPGRMIMNLRCLWCSYQNGSKSQKKEHFWGKFAVLEGFAK